MSFSDLGISASLVQTVTKLGYSLPTPIQQQAIPHILCGRDIFGCAQTGTGKTASFLLPMIDILQGRRAKARMPRAIILEPTRELAAQVLENFNDYSLNESLKVALLVGGESLSDQEKLLDKGVDVLIATPGRLLDLFERGRILLADLKLIVIDEADRMLDMGFIPDVNRLIAQLPKIRQTLLFSATMPDEIKKLANSYLTNPKEIIISPSDRTATTVTQHIVNVTFKEKRFIARFLLRQYKPTSSIIFCNRKRDVDVLTDSLKRHGFHAATLHGDMTQTMRNQTLDEFKQGKLAILVASDVAARGLDVDGLSLVINFDVPINAEDYVHRIGRTGRAGNQGTAVTLVTDKEQKLLTAVEDLIKEKISVLDLKIEPKPQAKDKEQKIPKAPKPPRAPKPVQKKVAVPKEEIPTVEAAASPEVAQAIVVPQPPRNNTSRFTKNSKSRDFVPREIFKKGSEEVIGFGDFVPAFMLKEPAKIPVEASG